MSLNRWKNEIKEQNVTKFSSFDIVSSRKVKNCLEDKFKMKPNHTSSYYFCLVAVILITPCAINTIKSVYGEQQMTQLSHNQNALFKDLSGPTSGKIQTLDVICGKNFMTVRAEFSGPFYGIVFSKGTYGQENCIYVKPNSGLTHAAFNVYYDQCGTKPDLQGKFYENTIVIQYGSDIIEAYDEAKRLRCEWFEAYEKPATFKPAIPVADLEVVEMNFQGDDIDCWMEIQEGAGPWSREVSKIVPVGQPMTIVVAINDYNGQFDMRVKSCVAHDGVQQPIALTDEFGCVLRPKMLTPFTKVKNPGADKKATVLSYSRFLAFKFPDSMTVQIQCTVEVCRHGCAEACQRVPSVAATSLQPELSLSARWPSQSNQPAIEGPRATNRVQYNGNTNWQLENFDNFRSNQQYAPNSNPSVAPPHVGSDSITDDMSGSDSSQLPAIAQHQSLKRQESAAAQESYRVPQYMMPAGRPSYGSRPYSGATRQQPQASSTTSTSTSTTTTQSPTTMQPSQQDSGNNRVGEEAAPEVGGSSNEDRQINKLSDRNDHVQPAPAKTNDQDSDPSPDQPPENKAEASQVKPTVVLPEEHQQQANSDIQFSPSSNDRSSIVANEQANESSDQATNKQQPSVQASDEINQDADSSKVESDRVSSSSASSGSSSGSSLKTVEVEIPANEDPVRTLISSSQNVNTISVPSGGAFSANRLSNVDLSSSPSWAYTGSVYQQQNNQQQQTHKQQHNSLSPEQVIQPRESSLNLNDKRDKGEDSSIEAMMSRSKSGFGIRSQAQSSNSSPQVQAIPEGLPSTHYNHQHVSEADHQQGAPESSAVAAGSSQINQVTNKENLESANSDKVLIDRSDDSASLTDSSSPILNNNESPNKPDEAPSVDGSDSESVGSSSAAVDEGTRNKVKPVVGTEELASGPLQLEDRIGSQSQESLEEALSRLQQQIPQTAALTSSKESDSQQVREQKSSSDQSATVTGNDKLDKPDSRADATNQPQQVSSESEKRDDKADQRLDIGSMLAQHNKKQAEVAKAQQSQRMAVGHRESSQPYPNIVGQAKVIPDPNSNLNTRNPMLAQASNNEPMPSVLPANAQGSRLPQQPPSQQAQQQQLLQQFPMNTAGKSPTEPQTMGVNSKPIAQITNVPINIGFPQSQIPAIQQFSQQLAYFQQQQQQQQQPKSTTAKPMRSRFNLLSPQAALHAVASRFLPKAVQQAAQQPAQHQAQLPAVQQSPQQMMNGMKLTTEQHKLFNPLQQQPQQQQQQHKFFLANQGQQPQQQAFLPGRFASQQQQPSQQQQQSLGAGLFGRVGSIQSQQQQQQSQSQQPLIRSRRSAMLPTGKRGNGEVGITKTFMVVTGMDLAFLPNSTDTQLPPILEGRRLVDDEVIYGICMPVVSLTFVLTCAFWLIVFIVSFCIYMLIKSRQQRQQSSSVYISK